MELDDPLDWSIDQVVTTLCDRSSPCLQISANSVVPDLDALAKRLRDNLINGLTLLTTVNDDVLREDLGLKTLGHRAFMSRAIRTLRTKSVKFREQEREAGMHTPMPSLQGGVSDTQSPLVSGFPSLSPSVVSHNSPLREIYSTPKRFLDDSTGQTNLHYSPSSASFSPEGIRQHSGPQPFPGPFTLGFRGWTGFAPPGFDRLKFSYAQASAADGRGDGRSAFNDACMRSPQLEHGSGRASLAGRSESLGSDVESANGRHKEVPILIMKETLRSEHGRPPSPGPITGKTIASSKERRRVAPTLVAPNPMTSRNDGKFNFRGQAALRSSPNAFKSARVRARSQTPASSIGEVPGAYLGAKKISVDSLFFGNAAIGQELQDDAGDEDNFVIVSAGRKPNGSRLYVNKLMRHYLFKPVQITFSRNGMTYYAVQPYSTKALKIFSGQRIPSYMLFSPLDHTIRVTKENGSYWPDVSSDGIFIENCVADSSDAMVHPLAFPQEDSENHEWDFLLKWQHMGSDIVPAQLGESGSEGEYDLDTWNEIEQEHGPLDRSLGKAGRQTLGLDEVNQAIDDGISELVTKWKLEKLPKRELKAWGIWKKSRRNGTKRFQIREAQHRINQIDEARLGKMRVEILAEIWKKTAAVRRQCRIMEQSIFDREDLKWKISLLERKREPQRPPPRTIREKRIKITKKVYSDEDEDVEVLGSGTDGFESGLDGDGLADFIVDDSGWGDTDMADIEGLEAESPDEEATPRRREPSIGASIDNPIRGIDDNDGSGGSGDPTSGPLRRSRNATSSSPLSSAKTLATPNVTRPNTPTRGRLDRVPEVLGQNQPSTFIDLTLSDSAEAPPNPFRSGRKIFDHTQKAPRSTTMDGKATKKRGLASTDEPRRYESLKNISIETFEKSGDKRGVIVCIVGNFMDPDKRHLMSLRLVNRTRDELLLDSITGLKAVKKNEQDVIAASDTGSVTMRLTYLYLSWIQSKQYVIDPKPSDKILQLAESKKEFFVFRRFLREVLREWEPDIFEHIPINYDTDDELRREAAESPPLKKLKRTELAVRGKVNVVTHVYDTDEVEGSRNPPSHRKRKRAVFENLSARNTRETDRQRLREQERRRRQLERRLERMGTTSAGDPSRIIVNTGKFEDQEVIFLNQHIGKRIKPHQIEGVQFMWRELVMDDESLQGCLLAHTMGLVTIAEAARSNDPRISNQIPPSLRESRSLVLCPPTLIDNWWDELLMWAPQPLENNIGQVRKVDSSVPSLARRRSEISAWYKDGGVLIMSYDIFRNFVLNKSTRALAFNPEQHEALKKELLNGPNIIIADEAHKLRNTTTGTAIAAAQFKSKSRIALTGSPLANSLEEYHSMIDWVAPGYLGPLIEFRAKYVEPIQEGLYFDSLELERRRCLKMLRVLKNDLDPKVHRADISVLKGSLPPKIEFVIKVPLTAVQKGAYGRYVQSMLSRSNGDVGFATLWDWLAILSLLCNHPLCFKEKLLERGRKESPQGNPTPISIGTSDEDQVEDGQVEVVPGDTPVSDVGITETMIKQQIALLDQVGSDLSSIAHSHRARIFDEILDASIKAGDKVLVFSHSIPTLNYLEGLLANRNRQYSRLDGSTKMSDRQKATKAFNRSRIEVYLISTRAGGLGLNLYGANRVIIFDFSFNPTWEEQAVGRAYRIGQKKPVFVYRLISAGTFEEVVHNKAVFKMQLAFRVVDKKNPTRYAMKKVNDYLFEPKEVALKDLSEFKGKDQKVLDKVLAAHEGDGCMSSIELTETFQRDDDDKLTAEEEREADQLLKDEQLKRSNPEAYFKMLSERQRVAGAKNPIRKFVPPPLPLATPTASSQGIPLGASSSSSLKLKKTALESANAPSSRLAQDPAYLVPPTENTTNGDVADNQPPNPEVSPFISAALGHEQKRRETH
ncbi:MAG: hypothetical protein M1839_007669 [Geoglossum umbratile]|nr:MAG: hypothetical protein M1839_007669 [Geoglossum umbratile]